MTTTPRGRFNLFLFGPDQERSQALTLALHRYFGVETTPIPDGTIRLHSPWEAQLSLDATVILQTTLSTELFPGEYLYVLGDDACHVLVLPLDLNSETLTQPQLRALLYLLQKRAAARLIIYLDARGIDGDQELEQLAIAELLDHLSDTGWNTNDVPLLIGDLDRDELRQVHPETPSRQGTKSHDQVQETTDESPLEPLLTELRRFALTAPQNPRDEPFLMPIEDRFNIAGHQTIATGRIYQGELAVGDTVILLGTNITAKRVGGIEMFRRRLNEAHTGDVVGLLLDHTPPDELQRGALLTKAPESFVKAHTLRVFVHLYTEERGGILQRGDGRDAFAIHIGPTQVTGQLSLAQGPFQWHDEIAPGNSFFGHLILQEPVWCQSQGTFAISSHGRSTGAGLILEAVSG